MEVNSAITVTDFSKKYKGFELSIPKMKIPKGFATALIGENGAGKTTLLNALSGIRLDYQGKITYFDREEEIDDENVRERIGYTGFSNYYFSHWSVKQVEELNELLFHSFHKERFRELNEELAIPVKSSKEIKSLSDGNKVKLMLSSVLARDTNLLILDEPASPLDPLMREKLCDMIRGYLEEGNGERSVFFSTHNISDMENVTDYCYILEHGKIVEQGFVEDLKEKYVLVKGETADVEAAKKVLFTMSKSAYGFEGICLSEKLDQLAGMDISVETPSLFQISVAVMKTNTSLKFV